MIVRSIPHHVEHVVVLRALDVVSVVVVGRHAPTGPYRGRRRYDGGVVGVKLTVRCAIPCGARIGVRTDD
jgi:hypothetical protein